MALLLAFFGIQPWVGYLGAVKETQQQSIDHVFAKPKPRDSQPVVAKSDTSSPYTYAEGLDFSSALTTNYSTGRTFTGLMGQNVVRRAAVTLFRNSGILNNVNSILMLLSICYGLFLGYLLRTNSVDTRLAICFLIPTMMEVFGPNRYAYADIALAPVVLIILQMITTAPGWRLTVRSPIVLIGAVCVLAALAPLLLSSSGSPLAFITVLRFFCLLAFANWFLIRAYRRDGVHRAISQAA
jgi:hypothetical protein